MLCELQCCVSSNAAWGSKCCVGFKCCADVRCCEGLTCVAGLECCAGFTYCVDLECGVSFKCRVGVECCVGYTCYDGFECCEASECWMDFECAIASYAVWTSCCAGVLCGTRTLCGPHRPVLSQRNKTGERFNSVSVTAVQRPRDLIFVPVGTLRHFTAVAAQTARWTIADVRQTVTWGRVDVGVCARLCVYSCARVRVHL